MSTNNIRGNMAKAWLLAGVSCAFGLSHAEVASAAPLNATSPLASSDAETTSPSNDRLEEIVVTAQKRSENLQSVPMVIKAISGKKLAEIGAPDIRDIVALTPGLVFTKALGNGAPYMRGVGQSQGDVGAESPVAVYVDGVYLFHAASGLFTLGSVAQIETLKGPQGTLFGRNAAGGLIHVIMKSPSFSSSEGSAEVGYGAYSTITAKVYGSTPITDNLASNLAISYQNRQDGYVHTLTPGYRDGKMKSIDGINKWVWQPSAQTKITLSAIGGYAQDNAGTRFGTPEGSLPIATGIGYLGFYTIPALYQKMNDRTNLLGSVTVEHDLEWARIKDVAAYNYLHTNNYLELSNAGLGINRGAPNFAYADESGDTISNELQIQAPASSKFQWIAGLYYLHDVAKDARQIFPTFAALNAGTPRVTDQFARLVTKSYAVFAQATKEIFTDTRVTLGGRYTHDTKNVSGKAAIGAFATFAAGQASVNGTTSLSFGKVTWKAVVDHDLTPDILAYASVSTGYKSGNYNLASFSNPSTKPETLRLYEAGVKSELLDRHLRVNAALFYQNYHNIQLKTGTITICGPNGCGVGNFILNAASSRIKGIDLDFDALLTRDLSLSGGFEVLSAKFVDFPIAPCTVPKGPPAGGNSVVNCDLSGKQMPRAPKFTANLGLNYTFMIGRLSKMTLNINDAHNSGFSWEPDGRLRQKQYDLLSASATWEPGVHGLSVRAWVRNILREHIEAYGLSGSSDEYSPDLPITFGGSVAIHF